ncbi:MAG: inorganic phosphate transporter [Bacteroidetes bacterium]|nr:MAG: inorganic phosphate transporter [Bacteroidota bacterium]
MLTFYLILVIVLFLLAISDLVVGVSNDAVNFLNSAVGAKSAPFKLILFIAALGILAGATFSSGMMEVARKGIFHPQYFYFSEIILLFLAVMVTDVILLDVFNTFGMPTSTTVSIVFELLGAAVAFSLIKIYTDPAAESLGEYINSGKALAIISGILLSVVVAFTSGVIIQYLSRLLFSFNYKSKLRYFGGIWGGMAIAAITYFMLIKGAKGASFMSKELVESIKENSFMIILISFGAWAIILQLLVWFTKVDILKIIVLVGTFALAMAFAGNDLVNFIGVPLAGYNSYQMYIESGAAANAFLMDGLAGKVPTPTILLLIAGLVMVITLWTSKKARSVVKTSLDLGRQEEGYERFASYAVSRSIVRNFSKMAMAVNNFLPSRVKRGVENQFDQTPFIKSTMHMGKDAPSFDMLRAAVTLVVASILIAIGTSLKLPLSTTYVTFMVFMGTSLADGAWGRESAVYRVSGVLSVIGGWFFTAFSAFTVAFIFAGIFYFGGTIAIILVLVLAGVLIYRTHRLHHKRLEEQLAFEKSVDEGSLTKAMAIDLSTKNLSTILGAFSEVLDSTLQNLSREDLVGLNNNFRECRKLNRKCEKIRSSANKKIDLIDPDEMEAGHMYVIISDYLNELGDVVNDIVRSSLSHVDNNHKPLLQEQIDELKDLNEQIKDRFVLTINAFKNFDSAEIQTLRDRLPSFVKKVRTARKNQIKRIKRHEIGTRNSVLYLGLLGEFRNLALFSNRMLTVFEDMVLDPGNDKD